MSLHTVGYLIRKEFIQFRRTRAMIAISFGVPIIQLIVLGFAISGDVEHVPTSVTDLDRSPASRAAVEKLTMSRYIDTVARPMDLGTGTTMLREGEVILSVVIPRGFGADLLRGERPIVSVMADAQNANIALTGTGYVRRILADWSRGRAEAGPRVAGESYPIVPEQRILFNPELKSVYFMVPGIVVLLVTIVVMMLTAMSIVREREAGTLEQLLVTPITRTELLLGKTIPFAILGIFELFFALGVAKLIYGIVIVGSLPLFIAVSALYIVCILGVGILISTTVHTQQQALFSAWFMLMFFLLMSGFILPLENIPGNVAIFTYLNPLRYYMTVVRELFLKGAGAEVLAGQIAAIAVLGLVVGLTALGRFNKRLG